MAEKVPVLILLVSNLVLFVYTQWTWMAACTAADRWPASINKFVEDGDRTLIEGDAKEASKHFSQAIKLEPTLYKLYIRRADAYAIANDTKSALADYQHALVLCPGSMDALTHRGNLYKHNGQYQLALADLTEAISHLSPRWYRNGRLIHYTVRAYNAYAARAQLFSGLGQFQRAIDDLTTVLDCAPENLQISIYTERATLYDKVGLHSLAKQDRTSSKKMVDLLFGPKLEDYH